MFLNDRNGLPPPSPCLASDSTKWVVCNFQMRLHYWGWGYMSHNLNNRVCRHEDLDKENII